nr:hypothetical protein [Spirochaetota bacterium]
MKIKLFIFLFVLLFFWGCKSGVEKIADMTKKSKEIRVKLKFEDKIDITLDRDLVIKEARTGKKVFFPYKTKKVIFKNLDGKKLIN